MEVTRRLKIPRGARVIDIGSGNAPHPRADILCDRDLSGDHERSGPLVRGGRPLVLGEAHRLPFRDRAADYVIASHVVEHATDPLQVVGELQRVGRAGYLECPTPFAEHLLGWRYHRWYVAERDGRLLVAPKTSPDCFAAVFHQLAQSDLQFRAFMLRNPELFFVSLQWVGEVRVERVETIPWRDLALQALQRNRRRNLLATFVPVWLECLWHKVRRACWRLGQRRQAGPSRATRG